MSIYLIAPLYNEEDILPKLFDRLDNLKKLLPQELKFALVDDGSTDNTKAFITEKALEDNSYIAVILSRNYGHQYAVTAGMSYCQEAEAIMIIDGDLQDPPELIIDFYQKLQEGYDVVYAVRRKRKESWIKKMAYSFYYRLLKRVALINIPLDSGDFCMISNRVLRHMNKMPERSRYLRGMRAWVGFKQYGFEYERDGRHGGVSKYSFSKLLQLAFSGLINFSHFPIHFMSMIGGISIVISILYIIYAIYLKVVFNSTPIGFVSIIIAISFFSGIILLSLSLLGEYIIRIFDDVRNRPLFIVDELIKNKEILKNE